MTNRIQTLTVANIRYLLSIQELDREGAGVRCVDVAEALKVTKPSVHSMVSTLVQMGLLEKSHYGVIHLTELGEELARCYRAHLLTISTHFNLLLPEPEQAQTAALALMAELPLDSIEVMCGKLKGMLR